MEKCLKITKTAKDRVFVSFSLLLLIVYAFLGFLDVISSFVPYVLISYGVLTPISVIYIVWFFIRKKGILHFDPINIAFLVFSTFTIISMIVNKSDLDRAAVGIFTLLQFSSIALAVYDLDENIAKFIDYLIVSVAVFICIIALFSVSIETIYRLEGVTPNPNVLGCLCLFGSLCSVLVTIRYKKFFIWVLSVPTFLFCLAVWKKTDSNTAFFAFIGACFIIFVFYVLQKKNGWIFILLACVVVVSIAIFYILSSSRIMDMLTGDFSFLSGRGDIWKYSLLALQDYFFLGFGGNTEFMYNICMDITDNSFFTYYFPRHMCHNIYLQVFVEYGIVAFLSFIFMLIYITYQSLKSLIQKKIDSFDSFIFLFACSSLAFFMVHGLAESSMLYIGGPEQFIFMLSFSILYMEYKKTSIKKEQILD